MAENYLEKAYSIPIVLPAYTTRNLHHTISSFPDNLEPTNLPWNLLTFLLIAQSLKIDFLPITWAPALERVDRGGTSEIRQSLVNIETAFAYKRFILEVKDEEQAFQALIAELTILGREGIRANENLVRLEGVCWDPSPEKVWPVFVFEKAEMGNLMSFMKDIESKGEFLEFSERLELCADVGRGIWVMHSCSIAHGDIKPENILIFKKKAGKTSKSGSYGKGGYTAKITDFGYSVTYRHRESKIYIAGTPPWTAPEWYHRNLTDFTSAVKMDAYSFGLLCLFVLFYAGKHDIAEFRADLSLDEDRSKIAKNKVDETVEVEKEVKEQLRWFFEKALATGDEDREGDFGVLLKALTAQRAEDDTASIMVEKDPQMPSTEGFQLVTSISQLYLSDFRVRKYIALCLSESVAQSSTTAQNSIIQLALCYTLGFGVPRDEEKASDLMRQINKKAEDLQPFINQVNELGSDVIFHGGNYSSLTGQGFVPRIDYGQYYREQQLRNVELTYEREINDLSAALGGDHAIIESLKTQLSAIYADQGRWDKAETLLLQILETNTKLLGPDASGTQFSKAALAEVSRKLGKWAQAEALLREALEAQTRILGPHHPQTLTEMLELAATVRRQGRHDEARELEEQVVEISTQVFGLKHQFSLNAMANLASTYREEGRWHDAERIQVRVLKTSEEILGIKHADTLTNKGNLASTYVRLGEFSEAEKLQTELLEMRTGELGYKHPDTLASRAGLSFIYRSQDRVDEADRLDFELLDDSVEVLGPDHPDTLCCMGNVAEALWGQGQREDAEILERHVADRTLQIYGPNHPDTLISQGNLAVTYRKLGKWKEAEDLELKVLEGRRKLLGEDHQDTLTSKENLALTWNSLGRYSEARELSRSALAARRRILGEEHVQTLQSCRNLAAILVDQERWDEVVELVEPALEKARRSLSEEHPTTLSYIRSLTLSFLHSGRISDAQSLAQLALETSQRRYGLEHSDSILAKHNYSLVLAATEMRLCEAAMMQREVLEQCREVFGERHAETLKCTRNLEMMNERLSETMRVTELKIAKEDTPQYNLL